MILGITLAAILAVALYATFLAHALVREVSFMTQEMAELWDLRWRITCDRLEDTVDALYGFGEYRTYVEPDGGLPDVDSSGPARVQPRWTSDPEWWL